MFNSKKTVVFMSCGHPIHQSCYNEFTKHSYKCPICSRTIINMELQFRVLDNEIRDTIMPEEVQHWNVIVKCVDCGGRSKVKYHYLGLKCDHCNSYNTMQLKMLKGDDNDDTAIIETSTENKKRPVVENSLDQNFQFSEIIDDEESKTEDAGKSKDTENESGMDDLESIAEEDEEIDDVFVNNFVRVINNFEKYSSIGDAFRDWLNTTNFSMLDDNEVHGEQKADNEDVDSDSDDDDDDQFIIKCR
ncbi:unnamed protein product [Ambrosiozyma monospora]|uniref:Unnamed protein product n=1 Tax=Ambrosiozyma monospora TaxID=43982 RepID=A0ACB5U779_AMBMO|nr:unnamed protein product [Ambrosiozyma monospora]